VLVSLANQMSNASQPRLLRDAFGVFTDLVRCPACDKPQLGNTTRCHEPCTKCKTCGDEQPTLDDLSDELECARCFVARMATVEPVPPIAGTPEWLQTLRIAGAL
jgi:hypothetical protein